MIEVPIYIPAGGGDARERRMGNHLAATVAPGSAIVGRPDEDETMIVVYYEGNLYGAVNMVTFADRAMFAYWRMRDRYPTVALMAVPRSQLSRAATLYPEYGRVEVRDAKQLVAIAKWLGVRIDSGFSERVAPQLLVSGVRVGLGELQPLEDRAAGARAARGERRRDAQST